MIGAGPCLGRCRDPDESPTIPAVSRLLRPVREPLMNVAAPSAPSRWHALADRVLAGGSINRDEARALLASPDEELLDLLAAVYRLRHRAFGNTVQLFFLMNAKSGLCPEDCGYCSQSKVSEAEIPRYNLLSAPKLMAAAQLAAEQQSKTFCIVISARGPTEREIDFVCDIAPKIKAHYNLNICACLGLLTPDQARRLAAAGKVRDSPCSSPVRPSG